MSGDLRGVRDLADLARFFDCASYADLTKIIYATDRGHRYRKYIVPKKSGGFRVIQAPNAKLKALQRQLASALAEVYEPRKPAHGFIAHRSIVTNATQHLNKTYVFNVDLRDFFLSIHWGRVMGLFQNTPFNFDREVATVLTHICCVDRKLPMGAPTSPILSNMICRKLDSQLGSLAQVGRATYTRYADDITFSFTCSRRALPRRIVALGDDGEVLPGSRLVDILKVNGFEVNQEKVRIAGRNRRMEVTGITVNSRLNVPRSFVKDIGAMIHAWERHGLVAAQEVFSAKYDTGHRASTVPKDFQHVVAGKLAFLRSVRGGEDRIFNNLAARFNAKTTDDSLRFAIFQPTTPEQRALDSVWVVEQADQSSQGTGFFLDGYGFVTAAHVVSNKHTGVIHRSLVAFRYQTPEEHFVLRVVYFDRLRDLAVCELLGNRGDILPGTSLARSERVVAQDDEVAMVGFPGWATGRPPDLIRVRVTSTFERVGVQVLAIDHGVLEGNSGGPVIDSTGGVIGVVVKAPVNGYGDNLLVAAAELDVMLSADFEAENLWAVPGIPLPSPKTEDQSAR